MKLLDSLAVGLLASFGPLAAQGVLLPNGEPDPAFPNLWSWWDARSGVNGNPAPEPDGTPVTTWSDRSLQARDLTRVSMDPSRLPTAVDSLDSCGPAVAFDGDDYIWGSTGDFGRVSSARTFFVVVKPSVADGGYVFDSSTASGRSTLHTGETANPGRWHVFCGDSRASMPNGYLLLGSDVAVARFQFHTIVIDQNRQEHYVDGVLVSSAADPNVFNLGGCLLGARFSTTEGLTGFIKQMLVYDVALGASDQAAIHGFLASTYEPGYGEAYGAGCAGTAGLVPNLALSGCPAAGSLIRFRVADAAPNAPFVVNFAAQRSSLMAGPCAILAFPILASGGGVTDAAGFGSLPLTIPANVGRLILPTQALVIDAAAAPFGIAVSNGLEVNVF